MDGGIVLELKKGTVLNGSYQILHTINKQHHYQLYAAMNEKNGRIYHVTEYYPADAETKEDGEITVPLEAMKLFEIGVNNLITDVETILALALNRYLKVVTAFGESGTGYVVTDQIDGSSFKDIMQKKKTPFTIDEATPVFLEFFETVMDAAVNHSIYFYIDPATVYVTGEGKLRLNYFYAHAYDEKSAAADIARFYYFMLSAGEPTAPIPTDDLPENQRALVGALEKACGEEPFESMQALYETLDRLYQNTKEQPAAQKKSLPLNLQKLKGPAIVAAIVLVFVSIIAVSSFFISKLILEPKNPEVVQSDPENLFPEDSAERTVEFDVE